MRFRPLHDRVLVEPDRRAPRKIGGLSVPKGQEEEPNTGIVVAAGPLARRYRRGDEMPREMAGGIDGMKFAADLVAHGVCIDDRVQWAPYAGREVSHLGTTHKLLRLEEIDGVLEDSDE